MVCLAQYFKKIPKYKQYFNFSFCSRLAAYKECIIEITLHQNMEIIQSKLKSEIESNKLSQAKQIHKKRYKDNFGFCFMYSCIPINKPNYVYLEI